MPQNVFASAPRLHSVPPQALEHIRSTLGQLRATFETGRTRSYEWRAKQLERLHALLSRTKRA
jgi:acyl-CoA reductase-like NAD-dependent aldehyde dehydrogenase